MTRLVVQRESLGTNTQHVSVSFVDGGDEQVLVSSDFGLPITTVFGAHLNEGLLFKTGYAYDFSNKLEDSTNFDIVIAFGTGIQPRVAIEGLCVGDAMGYIYEGTSTTGGTALPELNLNRNSTNVSNSAAVLNPTINTLGTLLGTFVLIGGQKNKATGGDISSTQIILKPLTNYLFRMRNVSGFAQAAEMTITWYE